jgi:hypothetical protein
LSNIVSVIEPTPKAAESDVIVVIEHSIFDLLNVIVNGHFEFEPMIKQVYFHDYPILV